MKVILSGLNGTLAPVLGATLIREGMEVSGWDRALVPTDDHGHMLRFLDQTQPDWVCHLAMGSEKWAGFLAEQCQLRGIGFLFSSSAMVFDHSPNGPHAVADERTAKDDYGLYKIRCEDAIRAASSRALIVRIGWQIGSGREGNQMVEALYSMMEKDSKISASECWIPATSFMTDTCDALLSLMARDATGTFHIDSNVESQLSFAEIVKRLKRIHDADWLIETVRDYVHDQRLIDERVQMPSLSI